MLLFFNRIHFMEDRQPFINRDGQAIPGEELPQSEG
jgi:hypothetical protein